MVDDQIKRVARAIREALAGKDLTDEALIAAAEDAIDAMQGSGKLIEEALRTLYEAKHIKDTQGKTEVYKQLKKTGWEMAEEALAAINTIKGE